MSTRLTRLPRLPSLPNSGRRADYPPRAEPEAQQPLTDQYGLSVEVFGELPSLARKYIARAFDELGLDKRITPTRQMLPSGDRGAAGTIPEMIFFGGLLEHGYGFRVIGKGFEFQSELLGGRIPGGSVADFLIFNGPRQTAVFVQSFFHSYASPFAGGSKVEEDRLLFLRLQSLHGITAVVTVNDPDWGFPLEHGSAPMIRREIERAIHA